MSRFTKLFTSRSFTILLFHLGLLFFLWPILSIPADSTGPVLFKYIFIAWTGLVLMLFIVGTSIRKTKLNNKDSDDV